MKLVAVQKILYGGVAMLPGDEFEASDQDARILVAHDLPGGQKCRKAEEKPAQMTKAPSAPPKQPAAPPAQDPPKDESLFAQSPDSSEALRPARRRYQRRDMEAED